MSDFAMMAAQSDRDAETWIEGFNATLDRHSLGAVGAELVAIDDDSAVLEMEISDASRQPMGLLHGGVSLMLAESVASLHSAWLCDLSQGAPVGVDINGTHIRSAREGRVRVTGRVLRQTRAFVFHEVEVEHVDTGELLSRARVTNYIRPHR